MKDFPIIKVKVNQVDLAPWNYKEDDNMLAIKLMNAMDKGGYISKIVVSQLEEEPESEKYEVIDGNHRVMALREKGIEEVQAIFVGRIKRTQRQRLGIELNDLKFQTNNIKLAEIFSDLKKEFQIEDLVQTMPYNAEEIEDFDNLLNQNQNSLKNDNIVIGENTPEYLTFIVTNEQKKVIENYLNKCEGENRTEQLLWLCKISNIEK